MQTMQTAGLLSLKLLLQKTGTRRVPTWETFGNVATSRSIDPCRVARTAGWERRSEA